MMRESEDERARASDEELSDRAGGATGVPPAGVDEQRCDLCGAPLLEWHCRLICTSCGFQRDCSDP